MEGRESRVRDQSTRIEITYTQGLHPANFQGSTLHKTNRGRALRTRVRCDMISLPFSFSVHVVVQNVRTVDQFLWVVFQLLQLPCLLLCQCCYGGCSVAMSALEISSIVVLWRLR